MRHVKLYWGEKLGMQMELGKMHWDEKLGMLLDSPLG